MSLVLNIWLLAPANREYMADAELILYSEPKRQGLFFIFDARGCLGHCESLFLIRTVRERTYRYLPFYVRRRPFVRPRRPKLMRSSAGIQVAAETWLSHFDYARCITVQRSALTIHLRNIIAPSKCVSRGNKRPARQQRAVVVHEYQAHS